MSRSPSRIPEGVEKHLKVKVKFWGMTELLSASEGEKEVQADFAGDTVNDLLHHLLSKADPEKKGIFLSDRGEITPDLLLIINGKMISDSTRFSQPLQEGDLIELALSSG